MNPNETQNLTLTSCEYTPIYVIQNNTVTQATSYVLASTGQDQHSPATSSLKLFYENSGSLENNLLLNSNSAIANPLNSSSAVTKPLIAPKPAAEQIPNNLKLASFLVSKPELNKTCISNGNPRVSKPPTSTNNTNAKANFSIISSVVNIEKDEVAKAKKSRPIVARPIIKPKAPPKPKELVEKPMPKHASFQLLKLGGTYHSLNHLSEDQMKLVNKALENVGDPQKTDIKPTYDPITNTKIVYKVISPNNLKVVGNNKIVIKDTKKKFKAAQSDAATAGSLDQTEPGEIKVTRSGRKVKQPKHIEKNDANLKNKKKSNMTCMQCSIDFVSAYRLQRHYETHPAHTPSGSHSSLFNCLLSMLKSGSETDKCAILIRQLQQLMDKLKALVPCLTKTVDDGKGVSCEITEDIGRLLGLCPGKYNLNLDALDCVKDSEGHCKHNLPKSVPNNFSELSKLSQLWLSKHQEQIANSDAEGEHCARINSVEMWQVKRIWKQKQRKPEKPATSRKKRVVSEVIEPLIDLGNEIQDSLILEANDNAAPFPVSLEESDIQKLDTVVPYLSIFDKKNKGSHTQFHSTHFDIRSSPIKGSSAVFNKFQIVPEKIQTKSDVTFLRPLMFSEEPQIQSEISNITLNTDSLDLNGILKEFTNTDTNADISSKDSDPMNGFIIPEQSNDSFLKSTNLIESILNDRESETGVSKNFSNDAFSAIATEFDNAVAGSDAVANSNIVSDSQINLNFLDSLSSLTCPDTEMRNNSIDFQLDLFSSFNNS